MKELYNNGRVVILLSEKRTTIIKLIQENFNYQVETHGQVPEEIEIPGYILEVAAAEIPTDGNIFYMVPSFQHRANIMIRIISAYIAGATDMYNAVIAEKN